MNCIIIENHVIYSMDLKGFWFALFYVISTLDVSHGSVNTCREPTVKDTLQSSTYATGTESSKAVDGCITQRYSSGCCMHTATDGRSSAYWAVDFNENIVIESIKIYYRDEPNTNQQKSRFGGYEIYISNSTSILSPCYEDTVSTISAVDLAPSITSCTGSARYLGVYVDRSSRAYNWYSSSAVLEICEVEVYGCPVGRYGTGTCDQYCDSSCVYSLCDPTNGQCTYCADGTFKSGTICDSCSSNCIGSTCDINTGECSACIDGFHGSTCDQLCSIGCSTGTCNQATGQCDGVCFDGYYGVYCTPCSSGCSVSCDKSTGYCSPCSSGYYGAGCDSACSDNCLNGECEQYTGTCGGCYSGFYGSTCGSLCPANCQDSTCGQYDGFCSACYDGYYGDTCSLSCSVKCATLACSQNGGKCSACSAGYYGIQCDTACPSNCLAKTCNQDDGLCLECVSGFYGNRCTSSCPSNCLNNVCHQLDGVCTECDAGYYGNICDAACPDKCFGSVCERYSGICLGCVSGTYGTSCENICPTECKQGTCSQQFGYCNECEVGIYGVYCNSLCPKSCVGGCEQDTGYCLACAPGYFGHDCLETCGQCKTESCEFKDGSCECIDGWEGLTCNTESAVITPTHDHTWAHAGGGMAGVVGLTLLLLLIFIILRRYDSVDSRKRTRAAQYTKTPPEMIDSNLKGDIEMTPAVVVPESSVKDKAALKPPPPKALTNEDEMAYMNTKDTIRKKDEESAYHNFGENVGGITVQEFKSIVDGKMANEAAAFQEEFKIFPTGLIHPHDASKRPANRIKNRFKNTLSYDHSRVVLETTGRDQDSDYINANYIDSVDKTGVYIASQGPKPKTVGDFWRMIWQTGSGKIVMLTNLQEGRKTKCHQYWPDKGEILSIDTFDVELDREITYSFYVIRDITITNTKTKQERQVHQFHFITWPDHGTPDNLEFVLFHRRVMSYKTFLSGQIVIHCSAGIGRTGTFIGYDALLTHWKRTGQIDVPSYMTTMRNSRMDMIQTHKQYIALHELLLEGYNLPDTYISRANFPAALEARYPSKDAPTSNTKILGEFKELKKCTPTLTASSFTAALRKENKTKNRDPKILAADKYRPFLQSQSPNRTDYINAVVIESYTSKLGFIITQLPLKETGEDFWAMVFDYNCQNIVVIGPLMKEAWLQYSSDKSKAFSVKDLQDLSTNSEVIVNEYEVVHVRSTNTRTVRVYCVPEWPSDSLLPNSDSSLIQLLEQLERRRQADNTIPVIVMCRNGSTQSGLFCCISNIRDQMKMDEEVDIFQAARQVISRRPEAIGNVEQYQYCYHILGKYLDATCVYMN